MGATHFSGPVVSDAGFVGPNASVPKLAAVDGALNVTTGLVVLTKGTAGAYTLAAPVVGVDDGKVVTIISGSAAAHVVTQTSPGFNGGGGASDVATFGGAVGDGLVLVAYGGRWLVLNNTNVVLA
jgi:hypothetical protein